jgi:predicted DNA-binding transcriptional regulator YafY
MDPIDLENVNKAQKLLLIFQEIARPQGAFIDELKEKFELDDRTFRRYVKNLIDINIPIQKEKTKNDFGKKAQKLTMAPEFQRSH